MPENVASYDPTVFTHVKSLDDARKWILTPQGGLSTDDRWSAETPYLTDLILQRFMLNSGSLVIDFGCGVGRLSKALIEATGCNVIGIDFSLPMRAMGETYVGSPNFCPMSPRIFDALRPKADLVLAVWVLQHVEPLEPELHRLTLALSPRGRIFVVNTPHRCVPSIGGLWLDDGVNVDRELRRHFRPIASEHLPADLFGPDMKCSIFAS